MKPTLSPNKPGSIKYWGAGAGRPTPEAPSGPKAPGISHLPGAAIEHLPGSDKPEPPKDSAIIQKPERPRPERPMPDLSKLFD